MNKPSDQTGFNFGEEDPAQEKAMTLWEQIRKADHAYYVLDNPILSDSAYDALFLELRELETQRPDLITSESPTQRVGGMASGDFAKALHRRPMLSLQNAFASEEVVSFEKRAHDLLGHVVEYVGEQKIDGLSISLLYRDGILVRAATRGDGTTGEDVTSNVRTIRAVPLQISPPKHLPKEFEVRGEIYMPRSSLDRLNKALADQGKPLFANCRNAAAGSLRQKDPKITATRQLKFFAYDLDPSGLANSQASILQTLTEMGFPVEPNWKLLTSIEEINSYRNSIALMREGLDHDIDGVVLKVNDFVARQELGFVSRSPRWAIAYKYSPEQAESVVEEIVCQVGRTGVITPVAKIHPVIVGGVSVSSVTLHNEEQVNSKGVYVGARVMVHRAGEVIPEIVSVAAPQSGWRMPTECPACRGPVRREEGYVAHRCTNALCSAQMTERLRHFASRPALDIEGLGEGTIKQLAAAGLVHEIPDLYYLTLDRLKELEGFGQRSAELLLLAIETSKKPKLERFLVALGIPEVGEATAIALADAFGNLAQLRQATELDLSGVDGVGGKMATSIVDFFSKGGGQLIDGLLKAGVSPKEIEKTVGGVLSGTTFVFTGSMEAMTRQAAEALVRSMGGRPAGDVSAKTNYLVAGPGGGSKVEKAKRLGVKVINEAEFLSLAGK